MTCRENRGSSAWTSYVRASTGGLTDQQMLSSFHELQREGVDHEAPPAAAVVISLDQMIGIVENGEGRADGLSAVRRASILGRLREARASAENGEGLPTGPQFYAWRQARHRADRARSSVNEVVAGYAQRSGTTMNRARQEFDRLVTESESGGRTGERLQPAERPSGVPQDPHTLHAVAVMEHVASAVQVAVPMGTQNRRVPDGLFRPLNSVVMNRVGFNPENGDCEVEFVSGYRYRMGNVPSGVVEDIVTARNPAAVFARMVRNPDYLTDQTDPEPVPEPTPEPVAVETVPARRSRARRAVPVNVSVDAAGRCTVCGQFIGEATGCQNPDCGSVNVTMTERATRKEAEKAVALAERVALYDAQPVTETIYCNPTTTRFTAEIFNPTPGISSVDGTICVRGAVSCPSSLNSAIETGPVALGTFVNVTVPTGTARSWGEVENTTLQLRNIQIGRTDPNRATGFRLIAATIRCGICGVPDGAESSDCVHARMAKDAYSACLAGRNGDERVAALQPVLASYRAELQTTLTDQLNNDPQLVAALTLNAERAARIEGRMHAGETPAGITPATPIEEYVPHPETTQWGTSEEGNIEFNTANQEAKTRMAAGQPAIPLDLEPWDKASTRGFGSEIEFFIPPANRQAALRAIGQALYDALPEDVRPVSPVRQGYGAGRRDTTRWRFERDQTVDAEIVSPIMYDNPETWRQFQIVCDIVKQHGGTVKGGRRTAGGHVHVGVGDFGRNVANHSNLAAIVTGHEDTFFRMSTAPGKKHRGKKWCNPARNPAGYKTFQQMRNNYSHKMNVNWQGVTGTEKDHVEIRAYDSSLDPGTIQAQIRASQAIADAAANAAQNNVALLAERETVGTKMVEHGKTKLSGNEWDNATQKFRRMADILTPHPRLKKQLAGLFAQGSWAA